MVRQRHRFGVVRRSRSNTFELFNMLVERSDCLSRDQDRLRRGRHRPRHSAGRTHSSVRCLLAETPGGSSQQPGNRPGATDRAAPGSLAGRRRGVDQWTGQQGKYLPADAACPLYSYEDAEVEIERTQRRDAEGSQGKAFTTRLMPWRMEGAEKFRIRPTRRSSSFR